MMTQDHGSDGYGSPYFWHPMANPAELAGQPQFVVASADGVHITDGEGRRFLDGTSGGLSVVNLGYSAAPIKQAMAAQLDRLPYFAAFGKRTHPSSELLSRRLIEDLFGADGMQRVFFTSGGSDSVETALRLARQYWKLEKQLDRYKFIALRNGYHGTHFGGASLNSRATVRRPYEPLLPGCFHIPTPWTYRNPFDETDPERLGALCARLLDEEIKFQGPETVAAFIAEPVTSAGGLVVPPANFWPLIREVCSKHGVLLIADEVITAFGRTGYETGCRGYGVKPDIMTIAKGITSGYFPLGATLINSRVAETFERGNDKLGFIGHGYSYSAHPVGCAAGLAALQMTLDLRVWEKARAQGEQLMTGLQKLHQKYEIVGDVRGKGLMATMEIVSDRRSKTPGDTSLLGRIGDGALKAGVLIRVSGTNINVSPPLICEPEHIDQILDALDRGLASC
jgi:adenosylmethionine-8-amino-7-oxononanoate aminotransferase